METKHYDISIKSTTNIGELDAKEQELVRRAQNAAGRAYAPYSKFKVGACLLLDNGQMIEGNNQENASYPCGCCAERTALNYANATFPDAKVEAIAISAFNREQLVDEPITPCGICRQALLETEMKNRNSIKVIMNGKRQTIIAQSASDLLPLAFDDSQL
ncbi:MAG: cytidine deaminase [Salinivirgaceae bacterium]|nr:cytidine deaminase [Salinivirgaceae bacterium]